MSLNLSSHVELQDDYLRVVDIERRNYPDAGDYKFWRTGVRGQYSFDDEDFVWFFERDEKGVVIAYALLDVERPDFVYLDDLGVSPDFSGRGHARNIMSRLVEWSAKDGRKMVLKVSADNARAKALYQKFGFDETRNPYMYLPENHVFMHLVPEQIDK